MKCEAVLEQLSLFVYGELSREEQAQVEDHLDACNGCRGAYEQEVEIHHFLDSRELDLPPGLLTRCRATLSQEVSRLESGAASGKRGYLTNLWRKAMDAMSVVPAAWLKPAGAVALVAIGFFGARLMQQSPGEIVPGIAQELNLPIATSISTAEAPLTRVRSIEPYDGNSLRIRVEEIRERVIQGKPESDAVRALLLAALRDSRDPGLRGESLDLLKNDAEADEVRATLLNVLRHDPNPGVRLKALDGLKAYGSDGEVRGVLKDVLLTDDNPGVRVQAIDLLSSHRESRMVPVLQELLRKEQNGYVRAKCQNVLRDMKASAEIF